MGFWRRIGVAAAAGLVWDELVAEAWARENLMNRVFMENPEFFEQVRRELIEAAKQGEPARRWLAKHPGKSDEAMIEKVGGMKNLLYKKRFEKAYKVTWPFDVEIYREHNIFGFPKG